MPDNVHTTDSVITQLKSDIALANEATGTSDTTMHDAVARLVEGYGGGGGGGASGIYMAQVTPETDNTRIEVAHNLGTTDILLAACWVQTFGDNVPSFDAATGKFWAKSDISFRLTSSLNTDNFCLYTKYLTSSLNVTGGVPTSETYCDKVADSNTFIFQQSGSATAKFAAGVTYTVIIIAANAEV